ncbi:hypothetical protein GIB67_017743 [Kingdonia uniflora]|uniref:Uncharacterized protein n=1 Tax=Kingdonia uniflora TaxID=39325 RepID=A0A7J7LQE1_9MAGN|nr:hypothetical protein GIB67_017743 [Kingdonia uniflora]
MASGTSKASSSQKRSWKYRCNCCRYNQGLLVLPSNFEEAATGVLKVLNNLALLDITLLQEILLFYKKLTRSDVHTCLELTGENIPFFAHDLIQHGFGDTVNVDAELITPRGEVVVPLARSASGLFHIHWGDHVSSHRFFFTVGRMVYVWYYWSGPDTIRVIIKYSIEGDAWYCRGCVVGQVVMCFSDFVWDVSTIKNPFLIVE